MSRLALWIGAFIFIAAALVALFSDWNWQTALILAAIGIGIIFFVAKG